jgi:site-specific DNA-adenine methylase
VSLQPFFSYFGGKWRLTPYYPAPRYPTIIEPFAGSAGYSVRNHHKRVVLVEKDPTVAGMWRWLLGASAQDVLRLPETVEEATGAQRALITFHRNQGSSRLEHSRVMKRGGFHKEDCATWCRNVRARIASQVDKIKHWQIIEGDYTAAPDVEATWFIDPPYQKVTSADYTQNRTAIDFSDLGAWCRSRRGQVIVCEGTGADWLPFRPFRRIQNLNHDEALELVWTNDEAAA